VHCEAGKMFVRSELVTARRAPHTLGRRHTRAPRERHKQEASAAAKTTQACPGPSARGLNSNAIISLPDLHLLLLLLLGEN